MNESLGVWLDDKKHSIEDHIFECILRFINDRVIWGPASCHDNTIPLGEAISMADSRFKMSFTKKGKTVEGHTRYISVSSGDQVLLNRLSTHDNMAGLVSAINLALDLAQVDIAD
ncbi:hypothetical protein RB598_000557 [Gaeumannomyces tritici]